MIDNIKKYRNNIESISPLFILLFFNYQGQKIIYTVPLFSIILLVYIINNIKKTNYILLILSIIATFDCILSIILIFYIKNNFSKKIYYFIVIYITVFVVENLLSYNYKIFFIYFYGIPITVISSIFIFFLIHKFFTFRVICNISIFLLYLTFIYSIVVQQYYSRIKLHIGISHDKDSVIINNNSIIHTSPNIDYRIINEIEQVNFNKNNLYSIFLPEYTYNLEHKIRIDDNIEGIFYLYGEHDNYKNFIKEESNFVNGNYQQKSPWGLNKPIMERTLLNAIRNDFFLCSNIGTVIKNKNGLIPKVWFYENGIPKVLIAEEKIKEKIINYIGDSDIIINFLVPYNSNFIASLYKSYKINDIIIILLLIVFLVINIKFQKLLKYADVLYIIFMITILCINFIHNKNIHEFDFTIDEIQKIKSPHIENNYGFLAKNISQLGYSVSFNSDLKSKFKIISIGNHKNEQIKLNKNRNYIIFIGEESSLTINDKKYFTDNIPEGNKQFQNIFIYDIRYIYPDKKPIISNDNYILIGTNSPQRFNEYKKIIDVFNNQSDKLNLQ